MKINEIVKEAFGDEDYELEDDDMSGKYGDTLAEMVARRFGTEIEGWLGKGEWGDAYETINGKVIKITRNDEEAEIAQKIKGKNIPHLNNIYDVAKLPNGEYAIYQEMLDTGGDIEGLFDDAYSFLQEYELDWCDDFRDFDKMGHLTPELSKFMSDICRAVENAARIAGVPALDISGDNIGKRGNDYIAFDIMNNWPG